LNCSVCHKLFLKHRTAIQNAGVATAPAFSGDDSPPIQGKATKQVEGVFNGTTRSGKEFGALAAQPLLPHALFTAKP
jgi:hypothetical protein